MQLAMIGLGKMGANMARRLARNGHAVVAYNRTVQKALDLADQEDGVQAAKSFEEVVQLLDKPRIVWMMVPAGTPTEDTIDGFLELLEKDDVLIDGGNSNFKDTMRRAQKIGEHGVHFVDVGTSGGIWGLKQGYSMMIGGEENIVESLHAIFETLAPGPQKGWGYVGPSGAGHFVKMVHNGIEYGAM